MSRSREAGFTLIELVVALGLSAFVSVILLHGIRLATAGFEHHTRQAERLDTRQSLDQLLRRMLGSAALVPRSAGGEFVGRADAVAFYAVAEDSGPGLYRITLAVDRTRPERPLVLRRQLVDSAGDPRGAASSILASKVRQFRLTYFGADEPNAEPSWHDRWQSLSTLPLLVRVMLDAEGEPKRPPIIVRLWSAG
jgi:prepilin-type N-terminal cleavage/methylation domain-containing protein